MSVPGAGGGALYQELILDHSRTPEGQGDPTGWPLHAHQVNPTCGDEITLGVRVEDGRVAEIAWTGHGCAISQASASMLVGVLDGADLGTVHARAEAFREVMRSRGASHLDPEEFGDAVALDGVSRYVGRVKCAMLPWTTLEEALRAG
ncbi:Fe-S cluster assembly sulfur transfer protein SufU [Clavibacter phaseoli]|uniref:Fe-S cluster assembly sulfur transfer protein SufU n=1 Tax=Clavibacter phaseoli TaxID=1734031 RepID=UPI000E65F968|nr:SUF system NifU family Fe-S cluster assembly protein [Clavibacter phaseoli]RIJ59856.1 SUF system NifU family Fe-S cluster assembly protein [Clavibacter phaseoli]